MACERCGSAAQGDLCSTCEAIQHQEDKGTTADERARREAIAREHGSANGGDER